MSKHGYPDWGVYAAKQTIFTLQDLAEAVARLGGILTYDRAGDLVWYEAFEQGFDRWTPILDGSGADVSLKAGIYRSSGYSCELVTGSDGARLAGIEIYLAPLVAGKLGLEMSFTLTSQLESWEFYFDIWTSSRRLEPRVRYIRSSGTLQIRNSAAGWTTVATGLLTVLGSSIFHTMKVAVDVENLTYRRLLLDDLSYDLSSTALRSYAATVAPLIFVYCEAIGAAGSNPSFYVDDVIITQNEP